MMNPITFLIIYFVIINIVGFAIMGIDKRKAIKKDFRISESTFIKLSILGGALGNYLGMYLFRHKTLHKKFYIGIPLIMIFNIICLVCINKLI